MERKYIKWIGILTFFIFFIFLLYFLFALVLSFKIYNFVIRRDYLFFPILWLIFQVVKTIILEIKKNKLKNIIKNIINKLFEDSVAFTFELFLVVVLTLIISTLFPIGLGKKTKISGSENNSVTRTPSSKVRRFQIADISIKKSDTEDTPTVEIKDESEETNGTGKKKFTEVETFISTVDTNNITIPVILKSDGIISIPVGYDISTIPEEWSSSSKYKIVNGVVKNLKVLETIRSELDKYLEKTVKQWKYSNETSTGEDFIYLRVFWIKKRIEIDISGLKIKNVALEDCVNKGDFRVFPYTSKKW